jgi:transcriptional regulator with PAS, ATPase and Fis domain
MNCGPMRISNAMTNGLSLSSIEDLRANDRVIGSSRAWSEVIRRATQVAARDATTCIQGESGTGKEVTGARQQHRPDAPRAPHHPTRDVPG